MTKIERRKIGPSQWALVADGVVLGRYGGREGDRWAQLADGTDVTDHSPCSAATVRGLLEQAIKEER